MKSFLATFILISAALSVPNAQTTSPCERTYFFRARSRVPVSAGGDHVIDHIETADIADITDEFLIERQIATICKDHVEGTVPLYRHTYRDGKLHFTSLDHGDSPSEPIGYVFTDQESAGEGSYKIFQKRKYESSESSESSEPIILTTEERDEGITGGFSNTTTLFYSLPWVWGRSKVVVAPSPHN